MSLMQQYKIELSKTLKEFKELKIKLVRLLNELAENINPFFGEDIESISAEQIEQAADELLETKKKAIEVQKKIKGLERELQ